MTDERSGSSRTCMSMAQACDLADGAWLPLAACRPSGDRIACYHAIMCPAVIKTFKPFVPSSLYQSSFRSFFCIFVK